MTPEISTAAIVVIGEFSPAEFHPSWFVERNLLAAEEANGASEIIIPAAL
jgi:hypothetical protein